MIRPTLPEDLPSLSALFADRFGHPLEADEWHWKYRLLPGEARSFVAVQDGEVIAHAGALCSWAWLFSREPGATAGWRGRGGGSRPGPPLWSSSWERPG